MDGKSLCVCHLAIMEILDLLLPLSDKSQITKRLQAVINRFINGKNAI